MEARDSEYPTSAIRKSEKKMFIFRIEYFDSFLLAITACESNFFSTYKNIYSSSSSRSTFTLLFSTPFSFDSIVFWYGSSVLVWWRDDFNSAHSHPHTRWGSLSLIIGSLTFDKNMEIQRLVLYYAHFPSTLSILLLKMHCSKSLSHDDLCVFWSFELLLWAIRVSYSRVWEKVKNTSLISLQWKNFPVQIQESEEILFITKLKDFLILATLKILCHKKFVYKTLQQPPIQSNWSVL